MDTQNAEISSGDHLTDFYCAWCKEEGLPDMSADDLRHEYQDKFTGNQLMVLNRFIELWIAIYE